MSSSSQRTESIKVVVVGETGVGKTALIHRFTDGNFTEDFKATVGADFSSHWVDLTAPQSPSSSGLEDPVTHPPPRRVQLHVWDTAGQERYRSLSTSYFKGCEAAMVVFDVCNAESFRRVPFWFDDILRGIGRTTLEGFPVFVIGNKVDCAASLRQVTDEEAAALTRDRGIPYMCSSARTGLHVVNIFRAVANAALDMRDVIAMSDVRPQPVKLSASQQSSATQQSRSGGQRSGSGGCEC